MEQQITVNTILGQNSFKTKKLIGNLNSIIIDTDSKIEIIIESENGYLIFHRKSIEGVYCLAIRNKVISSVENTLDYLTFDKFLLDEHLIITVIGQANKEVNLIIKID